MYFYPEDLAGLADVLGAGVLVVALLIGRAHGYTDSEKAELDQMIVKTVVQQFGASALPIISNMDFGHTDPQWLLPLGVRAEINCEQKTFQLLEAAVV